MVTLYSISQLSMFISCSTSLLGGGITIYTSGTRILPIKNKSNVFKRPPSSFRISLPNNNQDNKQHAHKHKVVFPRDPFKRNRVNKLIKNQCHIIRDRGYSDTLSTQRGRPDLRRVRQKQRRESDVVARIVDEQERDHSCSDGTGTRRREAARQRSDEDIADQHDHSRCNEERTAASAVDKTRAYHAHNQVPELEEAVYECLVRRRGYTDCIEDKG